jgi:hypothetical protein
MHSKKSFVQFYKRNANHRRYRNCLEKEILGKTPLQSNINRATEAWINFSLKLKYNWILGGALLLGEGI